MQDTVALQALTHLGLIMIKYAITDSVNGLLYILHQFITWTYADW